jgi:SAM-dependent methyltransferase
VRYFRVSLFATPAEFYDAFMGRYAQALAPLLADFAGVAPGMRVLEVGAGPGALTEVLAHRVGAQAVAAAEPSSSFAATCAQRVPGADVREVVAESLPWDDATFDVALAQLVLNFMRDAATGVFEMQRVVKPEGVVAGCTWDSGGGMTMLRIFWGAARALDLSAPVDGARARFGSPDELLQLWTNAGFDDVSVEALDVEGAYEDFEDFWRPLTRPTGPAGVYCTSLTADARHALREECRRRLGYPESSFRLGARSWAVRGRKPPPNLGS